ncbi:MAG: hypothetical protein ABI743_14585, partial [bacterium]
LAHYTAAGIAQSKIDDLGLDHDTTPSPGSEADLLDTERHNELLEADRYATLAIKFPFIHNPDLSGVGWGLFGEVQLQLGQLDQAIFAFDFLVKKIDPDLYPAEAAHARANLAFAYKVQGNKALASRYAKEALVLNPDNGLASFVLDELAKPTGEAPTAPKAPAGGFTIPDSTPPPASN